MPELAAIIPLIIGIIVFIIAFKIIKHILKAIFLALLTVFIVVLVGGFFVVQDAIELKEKFPTEEKIILIENKGQLELGMKVRGNETEAIDVSQYEDEVADKQFKQILQESYMLIIIKVEDEQGLLKAGEIMANPVALMKEYREGNVIIYPETLSFKLIKSFPGLTKIIGQND